ncbi:lipid-A-disaccharide synthase [Phenylobacterium sp.]|jgi:lipid-A-disaccharide synthase|uniref:lipid-A-disaccharide synthase n=1 Tax=Phenylobacterium sp. TaxID=1871053 RepID=UPI000C8D2FED|nr:lipid-A-disaccharide synthase [Phenylobacterium sp.]MAK83212.1 lipid-A-disaccharide synthase [Phenylobacterium sp.]
MSRPLCIMLVAAEASGDDRGAGLMAALKRRLGPDGVRFVGLGGARMTAEGLVSPFDMSELSILGLLEGLLAYRRVVRRADEMAALARREQPDLAILIDSWGFTLRVAQRLKAQSPDLPVVKYVAPQVWASRPGRAAVLAKTVDHLLSIHTFDAPFFEKVGLPTTFVGNSTLSLDLNDADPMALRRRLAISPEAPVLIVLPGSRRSEIERVMPPFEDAVALLKAARPDLQVIVPAASTVADIVKARVAGWPYRAHVVEGEADRHSAMKAATVALACSGTVTTELALAGAPMVVGYRLGPVTYAILKRLIRTDYVTLFNIAAQDYVAPELIQGDCNGPALAREVALRLDDPYKREAQVAAQDEALVKMGRGGPDPSEAAALAVLKILGRSEA